MAQLQGQPTFIDPTQGEIEQLTPNNPGAGNIYTATVPSGPGAGEIWLPHAIAFTYTADANVANRLILITTNFTVDNVAIIQLPTALTASQSGRFYYQTGFPVLETVTGTNRMAWLWQRMYIFPGDTLNIAASDMQAGDVIVDIVIQIQKWKAEDV